MNPINPYAPPTAQAAGVELTPGRNWYMDGNTLVVERGASLPNVCLFNGAAVAEAPTTRTLYWAPQWAGLLVLLSPLIYVIVYMVIRKAGSLSYFLGKEARKRRTSGVLLVVLSVVMFVAGVALGAALDSPLLGVGGLLAFLGMLIVGAVRLRLFTLSKIDEQYIYLKLRPDAARAFAERLNEFPR